MSDLNHGQNVTYTEAESLMAAASAIPEKPFSTRITEAEEKALEGLITWLDGEALKELRAYGQVLKTDGVCGLGSRHLVHAQAYATAAALARDYARKEG